MTTSQSDFCARAFQKLFEKTDIEECQTELSDAFEFLAGHLLADSPTRSRQYFDGVVEMRLKPKDSEVIELEGEMWVGKGSEQWTESLRATIADQRVSKKRITVTLQIGEDICGASFAHESNELETRELVNDLEKLAEIWCDRRALKALTKFLPAYCALNGQTDGWGELAGALKDLSALAPDDITDAEKMEAKRLMIRIQQMIYR